jgi:hypothetical protein
VIATPTISSVGGVTLHEAKLSWLECGMLWAATRSGCAPSAMPCGSSSPMPPQSVSAMTATWFLCRVGCAHAPLAGLCNALANWVNRSRNVGGFGRALDVERDIRLAVWLGVMTQVRRRKRDRP